jgi:hypothetical protein
MRLFTLVTLAATLGVSPLIAGCQGTDDHAKTGDDQQIVVSDGQKLVKSVNDDGSVDLYKSVPGASLPYDAQALPGKALLIHPIPGKTTTGVYARMLSVEERDDALHIETEPLDFSQMEDIDGPNVVALYVDPALLQGRPGATDQSLRLRSGGLDLDLGIHPQTWSGSLGGQLGMGGSISFSDNHGGSASLTISQESGSVSLTPRAQAAWTSGEGLALGFNLDFNAESVLNVSGSVGEGGSVFETPEFSTPPLAVAIPIGPVPVPTSFRITGKLSCGFSERVTVKTKLHVTLQLGAGGSVRFQPSKDAEVNDWFQTGDIPWNVSGNLGVEPDGDADLTGVASLSCVIPRIALVMDIAGTGGPYLAVQPTLALKSDASVSTSVAIMAGGQMHLFGKAVSKEFPIFTWTPQ